MDRRIWKNAAANHSFSIPINLMKIRTANLCYLLFVLIAVLACSGCVSAGSFNEHHEKMWVQPAIVGGGWAAEEIESVAGATDDAATRHGLKNVPGIPPWHLFHPRRRITCNNRLSLFGQRFIVSAFYTQKDRHGPIIIEMYHEPGCPMIAHTKRQRKDCTELWSDLRCSLVYSFGCRVTDTRKPAPSRPN
jgi:hypothetical protein